MQHGLNAFMGGVTTSEYLARQQNRFTGFPRLDLFTGDVIKIDTTRIRARFPSDLWPIF
ncbi:Uncharacterised protein [Vibrio cholerae]|nr:Uncharacterised protein [Vibrio cholerae]